MKKLVVLMLAGMMSSAMITGCGSSSADTAAPAEAEETDAAADEAEAADTEDAAADEAEAADTADSDLAYVQDKGTLEMCIRDRDRSYASVLSAPEVKQAARYEVASYEEDGVLQVLKDILQEVAHEK